SRIITPTRISRRALPFLPRRSLLIPTNNSPNVGNVIMATYIGSVPRGSWGWFIPSPGGAVVEIVSVSGVEPLLAGVAGLKLQVAPCGRPEQRSAMVPGTLAFTVKVNVPDWPLFTVALLVPGVMVMRGQSGTFKIGRAHV